MLGCVCVHQVACMQFINIVVHSVEDMNFRVHLQYDFTKLCLDDYLDVRTDAPKRQEPGIFSTVRLPRLFLIFLCLCPAETEAHGERQAAGADPGLPGQRLRRGDPSGGRRDQKRCPGAGGGAGREHVTCKNYRNKNGFCVT